MSAAARPRDPSDEIMRVALAELRTFKGLTKNQSMARKNVDEIRIKTDGINEKLDSALASGSLAWDKRSKDAVRKHLEAFIGAVYAYPEFNEAAPEPKHLSPVPAHQRSIRHQDMWSKMREALNKLLDDLEALF